jgi:Carboxypeptidase regulatory-like domain
MSLQTGRLLSGTSRETSNKWHWLTALAVLTLCAVSVRIAVAQQSGAATLVGTITDSTGARIPGAQIVVVNVETSFRSETKTNAEGDYYVPYLRPGGYQITVDAAGFKRSVRGGVVLRTEETPRVDIVLEVGATSEQVLVTAAAPLLSTETATAGAIMGSATILAIPVAQKRANKLLLYFPEATGSSGYHVMGQRQRAIGYTLDGVSGKVPGTGAVFGVNDSIHSVLDAVEEAKVTTTGMSAETGHSAGGALSLVFKSGTNELHGSFEDRLLDGKFIQRYYLQAAPNTSPSRLQFIDATASGPLVIPKLYNGRNKTFWLAAYAIHLEHAGETGLLYDVPSEAMLNGDFSFGGQGVPLYDPFSTRQDATGKWIRDPIPGNQISPSLFDPAVKKFLANNPFTKPNAPGVMTKTGPVQNLAMDGPKTVKRIRWDGKIDHQFTPNHKIFGRYSQAHHRADRAQKYPEFAWDLLDFNAQTIPIDLINIVFNDTLILGPGRFNEVRLGYYRRHYTLNTLSYGQDWAQKLGIPNVSGETFPFFNIGYRMTSMGQEAQVGEDLTFQNNFTQIIGSHTLKMGYELMRTRYNAVLPALPGGTYNFSGTDAPFTANTGNTFASFLLGTVGSAVYSQNFASWLPRWWQHALYLQDDWKVTRSLSLSLGVRWNFETPYQTKYGQQSQFDPTAIDPLTGRMGALTHPKGPLASKDLNNFQPRVGIAWNFRSKWVFRSSFGIMNPDLGANDIGQNFEEYQATTNVQSPSGDPRYAFRLSQGPPALNYPVKSDGSVSYVGTNYSARNASWYDPNMRTPYVMNWSAGFQRQLTNTWLMEMVYQGTAGVRLLNSWNINAIPLNISTNPAVLTTIYQAQQNYKPYPQFGSVNLYSNFGHNTHHAGTLKVERRYAAGMTLSAFYTYSKTLDENDADGGASGITYYNRNLEKGRAGYDIRHRYTNVLTYELPLGRGRRWVNKGGILNGVLGGWDLTWVQTFESGLPTSVTFAGSPYTYLSQGVSRPNALVPMEQAVVQNWDIGPNRFPTTAQNPYLKFSAFAYPAAFTVGTLGRNTFESPGMSWTQMSISKSWSIWERVRIITRLDMMNLPLKQPQFTQPNSVYNANNPATFGTFTGTRGDTSNVGTGQPNMEIDIRIQF